MYDDEEDEEDLVVVFVSRIFPGIGQEKMVMCA